MAQLFNYTGGREGTHAVTLCKPVGGGVADIENVPIDQANNWITQYGYMQCDGAGGGQTGYCLSTPHETDCEASPYGNGPTPFTTVAAPAPTTAPVASVQHPTPTTPAKLPQVGSGGLELVIALVVAVVAGVITQRGATNG